MSSLMSLMHVRCGCVIKYYRIKLTRSVCKHVSLGHKTSRNFQVSLIRIVSAAHSEFLMKGKFHFNKRQTRKPVLLILSWDCL